MQCFVRVLVGLCLILVAAWPQQASAQPGKKAAGTKEGSFKTKDGIKIHYIEAGEGSHVVLIHGYGSSAQGNWVLPGVFGALAAKHHVVALDCRNHGQSDKPQASGMGKASDVVELMDHLKLDKAHIAGYSMGGMITNQLLGMIPERFLSATFGGSSLSATAKGGKSVNIADIPMLIVNGEKDGGKGRGASAERTIKKVKVVEIPGATHTSAVATPLFRTSIVEFIAANDAKPAAQTAEQKADTPKTPAPAAGGEPKLTKVAKPATPSTPEAAKLIEKAPPLMEGFFKTKDGNKIHYLEMGDKGPVVVLVHGYTSSAMQNWYQNGNMAALAVNHRVVAIDCLNHGDSDKPKEKGTGRASDVLEMMDFLKIKKAHIAGYSMGGGITGTLLKSNTDRFITATFAGSAPPAGADFKKLNVPIMVINGEMDGGETKGERVKDLKDKKVVSVPGRGHMNAPSHPVFISSMVEWINSHDPTK